MDAAAPIYTFGCATRDDKLVWPTLAVLRMNLPPAVLARSEFVVIDNSETTHKDGVEQPNKYATELQKQMRGAPGMRYVRAAGPSSSSLYRDRLFKEARGKYVVCFDPHVFFPPGSIESLVSHFEANPETSDLIVGPLLSGMSGSITATHQKLYDSEPGSTPKDAKIYNGVVCRGNQLAVWGIDDRGKDPAAPPFEVFHQGMGAFACRREAWPGWPSSFYGFGGCETYMMEAFRSRGAKVLCLPGFRWIHSFFEPDGKPYSPKLFDRVRNYLVGFKLLGKDDLYGATVAHYSTQSGGRAIVQKAIAEAEKVLNPKPANPKVKAEKPKPEKPAPKPDQFYVAALNRSGLTEEETSPEYLFREVKKTPSQTPTLEFGVGLTTLALDMNACNHTCVHRDPAMVEKLKGHLFHAETTKFVHDPDGKWKNKFDELYAVLIVHDASAVPAGLDLGTCIIPGGTIYIAETQKPENRELADAVAKQVNLPAKKWPAKYGQHKDRSFHVLKQPPEPLGEGPGTELKAMMAKDGFPPCQQCENLARRMNKWGVDGCRENMDEIVKDMLPRAKHWLKTGQPYAKGFLKYFESAAKALIQATHTDEASMKLAIRFKVGQAIEKFEAKVTEVGMIVGAMEKGTTQQPG
jgi:hypothetical protein